MSIQIKINNDFSNLSEEFNAAMGARLKEIRTSMGISQKDLTSLTKGAISQSNISALETGRRTWNSEHIYILSTVLGIQPHEFFPRPASEDAQEPTQAQMVEAALVRAFREGRAGDVASVALMMAQQAGRDEVASADWQEQADRNRELEGQVSDLEEALANLREEVATMLSRGQERMIFGSGSLFGSLGTVAGASMTGLGANALRRVDYDPTLGSIITDDEVHQMAADKWKKKLDELKDK